MIPAFMAGAVAGAIGVETVWRLWSDTQTAYWSVIMNTSRSLVLEAGMRDWFVEFNKGIQARPHFLIPLIVSTYWILATSVDWRNHRNRFREQSPLGVYVSFANVTSWLVIVSFYRRGSGVFGADYTFDPIVILVAVNLLYIIGVVYKEIKVKSASNRVRILITSLTVLPWLTLEVANPSNTVSQVLVVASGCGIAFLVIVRTQAIAQRSGVRLLTTFALLTAFFASSIWLTNSGTQFEKGVGLARRDVFKNRSVVLDFQDWVTSATGGSYTRFWYDASNSLMTMSQSSYFWGWTIATFQSSPTSPKLQIARDEPLLENSENSSYVVAMAPDRFELQRGIKDICPNALDEAVTSPPFSGYQGEFFAIAIQSKVLTACLKDLSGI